MDKLCPINEGQCYQISLQENDIDRLRLLREPTFTPLTCNQTYRLSDLLLYKANKLPRVTYWLNKKLDLRNSQEWAPVFVSPSVDSGLIVAIDGNHRLMAHFLQHQSIEGVNGYLFIHPNIQLWGFMPLG